ncbi:unnamed protein product, partial [Allacma fusca]
FPQGQR